MHTGYKFLNLPASFLVQIGGISLVDQKIVVVDLFPLIDSPTTYKYVQICRSQSCARSFQYIALTMSVLCLNVLPLLKVRGHRCDQVNNVLIKNGNVTGDRNPFL